MKKSMTPEQRVLTALDHKEPDRIPFDVGSSIITGININAYKRLLDYLNIERDKSPRLLYERSEIVEIPDSVLEYFKVDTRALFPRVYKPVDWPRSRDDDEEYLYIIDEFGITWRKPKKEGHFYDMCAHPLDGQISVEEAEQYHWPDFSVFSKVEGIKERAAEIKAHGDFALVLESAVVEVFTTPFMLRGYSNFYMDLAADPELAGYLMDKTLELNLDYWQTALEQLPEYTLILRAGDDLGNQSSPLISPEMYRDLVKPRHKKLFSELKRMGGDRVFIFFHSDGAVREFIPDLIEMGVDILNPVQYSAAGMDTKELKREFGRDISFWGGGIDTQNVLPFGSPQDVRDEVKHRIDDLAPGGGFVFGPVHNIQYDVPPENIMAMWETLQEYGVY